MEPPDGASRERYMYRRRSTCAPERRTHAGILPEEIPPEYLMIFMTFKFSNLTLHLIITHTLYILRVSTQL